MADETKPELKPGDTLDVKPEFRRVLRDLIDREANVACALEALGRMRKETNRMTFKFIEDVLPETRGYGCHVDLRTMKVTVLFKKTQAELEYEEKGDNERDEK